MAQPIRTDLVALDRSSLPDRTAAACPWCGHAGIEADALREVGFLVCDACRRVSPFDASVHLDDLDGVDDDDDLADTAEYELVPCGASTFRIERRGP